MTIPGEVYLARDTELKREVAIKALPEEVARDTERVARFEREARVLASMNHPNIGAIFGIERCDDRLFLVLELVRGDTLAERFDAGALTLREVLTIFEQIARALEAAHAKEIVHRDLKPNNVKITPEELVKVLDFGLATPFVAERSNAASKTKTAPSHVTNAGHILGTPAYMSPEQTRGEALDKRSDIWSFGCCLYEALTGRRPFKGNSISETLAAVLTAQPDFGALPRVVPRSLRHLLRRCLEKDVRRRLHDISDARIEIEALLERDDLDLVEEDEDRPRFSSAWIYVGMAVTLAVGWALGRYPGGADVESQPVRRFAIELPTTEPIALGSGPALALAPDGRHIVYTARRGSSTELRLRAMDQLTPTALPGTEGATTPFFAPAGEEIGFFAGGKLQTLSLGGLRVRALADGPSPRGASWGRGGEIVFSRCTVCGLQSVIADSTATRVATSLEEESDERSHRWPSVLPDGRSALFTSWTGSRFDIEWVSLDSGERLLLVEDGSYPRFASSGHLVFVREETLMAAAFDPAKPDRIGEPLLLLDNLHRDPLTGAAFYDISEDGTLVYVPRAEDLSGEVSGLLLHVDRDGSYRVALPTPRSYQVPRVSPTDQRLMFTLTVGEKTDVYITELARGALGRVTFEGNNGAAIWSPDGRAVFSSDRDGEALNLYSKAVDGSEPAKRLTVSVSHHFPSSWSPDGTVLAYTELNLETSLDIWLLSTASQRSEPWLQTAFNESAAAFSPDGKWLAYVSDETGQDEVYVSAFPGPGGKTTISSGGGREPRWSPDGSELYYREKEWLMAVSVATIEGVDFDFDAGAPRRLFEAPFDEAGAPYANYDVARESDGFIMVRSDEELSASRIVVVLNWFEELRRLVPTGP